MKLADISDQRMITPAILSGGGIGDIIFLLKFRHTITYAPGSDPGAVLLCVYSKMLKNQII